jgi:hypothetical protein
MFLAGSLATLVLPVLQNTNVVIATPSNARGKQSNGNLAKIWIAASLRSSQ